MRHFAKFERKRKDLALGVRQNTVPRVASEVSRYKVGHMCLRLCLRSVCVRESERDLLGIIRNGGSGAAPAHGGGSRIKVSHVCLRL